MERGLYMNSYCPYLGKSTALEHETMIFFEPVIFFLKSFRLEGDDRMTYSNQEQ